MQDTSVRLDTIKRCEQLLATIESVPADKKERIIDVATAYVSGRLGEVNIQRKEVTT